MVKFKCVGNGSEIRNLIMFLLSYVFYPRALFEDVELVSEMLEFWHSVMMWLTLHILYNRGSFWLIKKLCVRWVCPIRSILIMVSSFLLSSGFCHRSILFFILLCLELTFFNLKKTTLYDKYFTLIHVLYAFWLWPKFQIYINIVQQR